MIKASSVLNSIPAVLSKAASKFAVKNAMVLDTGASISYRDMAWDISRTAKLLRNCGIGRNNKVAVFVDSSPQTIETFYAVLNTGAVAVLMRYDLSEREIAEIFEAENPSAVFIRSEYLELVPRLSRAFVFEMADNRVLKSVDKNLASSPAIINAAAGKDRICAVTYFRGEENSVEYHALSNERLLELGSSKAKDEKSIDVLAEYIRRILSALFAGKAVNASM